MLHSTTKTYLKLRDAAVQMKLAIAHATDEETHRSCINAFISFARSVTLVMQKESGDIPRLSEWYQERRRALATDPLFRFFNEKRVHTIHRGVVEPARGTLTVRGDFTKTAMLDLAGRESDVRFKGTFGPEARAVRQGDVLFGLSDTEVIFWTFDGVEAFLPGHSGNVERLCEDYFVKLQAFVLEWEGQRVVLDAQG